jgi:hypothetical protein
MQYCYQAAAALVHYEQALPAQCSAVACRVSSQHYHEQATACSSSVDAHLKDHAVHMSRQSLLNAVLLSACSMQYCYQAAAALVHYEQALPAQCSAVACAVSSQYLTREQATACSSSVDAHLKDHAVYMSTQSLLNVVLLSACSMQYCYQAAAALVHYEQALPAQCSAVACAVSSQHYHEQATACLLSAL